MENVCPSADASLEQLASLLAAHEERMRRREKERRILAASLATRTACFASMRDDCAAEALAVERVYARLWRLELEAVRAEKLRALQEAQARARVCVDEARQHCAEIVRLQEEWGIGDGGARLRSALAMALL